MDPDTIDALTYNISTLSDGFALNWLVFSDRTAAERQIELTLGVLNAWMAAHLDNTSGPAAHPSQASPAKLVSWVSVE
ncbi:hypothetical protein CBI38_11820 [Rhodococcus oxybenzonivorans]|uniref:Uncharacterized protein n=1 Tax=Rhodococcus oxybenzonivorans TaxID=1990687 RepID=A0A2S2BU41_9NOCA|nr:hypothetical protein CBI38_11820 [Rhodococcus oxybenzonivorans]